MEKCCWEYYVICYPSFHHLNFNTTIILCYYFPVYKDDIKKGEGGFYGLMLRLMMTVAALLEEDEEKNKKYQLLQEKTVLLALFLCLSMSYLRF